MQTEVYNRKQVSFSSSNMFYLKNTSGTYHYQKYMFERDLTNSTEQSSSSDTNRCSDSQENHNILWNLNVHYHIQKNLLPVLNLNDMNPVQIL